MCCDRWGEALTMMVELQISYHPDCGKRGQKKGLDEETAKQGLREMGTSVDAGHRVC